jgi:hypothetical protein
MLLEVMDLVPLQPVVMLKLVGNQALYVEDPVGRRGQLS